MYKIALINMPFADFNSPSLALTQLKSILGSQYGDQVSVDIYYLNQDFTLHMGKTFYKYLTDSAEAYHSGLGDWLFRHVAFPGQDDNSEDYIQRYFPSRNEQAEELKQSILDLRAEIETLLSSFVEKYELDQAGIVGFTSMFSQNVASMAMAQKIKERNPNVVTVMGGANCETPMGEAIARNAKSIDFVFSGPGLKSFPEFVQYCLDQDNQKCHKIKGVFSKTNVGADLW